MSRLIQKRESLIRRKNRVRSRITGTAEKPRLTVSISNRQVSAQLIDDVKAETLVYVTSLGAKSLPSSLTEKAKWVGQEVAKKAKTKKIKAVTFDRNGRIFHGRIKALADEARAGGLEF